MLCGPLPGVVSLLHPLFTECRRVDEFGIRHEPCHSLGRLPRVGVVAADNNAGRHAIGAVSTQIGTGNVERDVGWLVRIGPSPHHSTELSGIGLEQERAIAWIPMN